MATIRERLRDVRTDKEFIPIICTYIRKQFKKETKNHLLQTEYNLLGLVEETTINQRIIDKFFTSGVGWYNWIRGNKEIEKIASWVADGKTNKEIVELFNKK